MNIHSEDLDFSVFGFMPVSPADAYEAVADPAKLAAHFTMGGASGRLQAGHKVSWEFADFPGAFEVQVLEAVPGERIAFDWPSEHAGNGATTRVTFRFTAVDDGRRCRVDVSETGWAETPAALAAMKMNVMGWAYMLSAMKTWLEHGIAIRPGMFR